MAGAQALCEPLVWRSAQANTKPNPIKATEIQVTTVMVSIGIVRSSEYGRIIWQFARYKLIEVKRRTRRRKYYTMDHAGEEMLRAGNYSPTAAL
jgi:hypothetical protein